VIESICVLDSYVGKHYLLSCQYGQIFLMLTLYFSNKNDVNAYRDFFYKKMFSFPAQLPLTI